MNHRRPQGRLASGLPLLLALALAAPAGGQGKAAPAAAGVDRAAAAKAARAITKEALEAPVRFLADDLLEGRGTASRGDQIAQAYLASVLEFMGYQPGAGNGSYIQSFDLVGVTAEMPPAWEFKKGGESLAIKKWDDYIASSGVQKETAAVQDAEVVFVGYGIEAPEYQWNDFKGVDLKGKVLLMLNNDPDWDPNLFAGKTRLYYGRWTYKYESAGRQRAAGAIIVHTTPSAGYPWQVVQASWSGEQFQLPDEGEPRVEVACWATEDAARRLVKMAGMNLDDLVQKAHSRDFRPVPLGITTSLTLKNKVERVKTGNVLGLLPGSDPKLKDEVVVYTAHHDHLGIGEPKNGDRIYNGALDNGAGMAQVLAIAKAFTALPKRPRRSILILFPTAEEQGLLGSLYYALHPTFPPGRIAANINYDGADIWGHSSDITYIGFGKTTLDPIVIAEAKRQGRTVEPDQFPDRGHFYRSDQFSFAKIGVPPFRPDPGTHFPGHPEDWGRKQTEEYEAHNYHQPSDEYHGDWNFDGMIEDSRLGFFVGLDVAQSDRLPGWKPGDEFEATRKRALAAVKGK
jgi:Zn-dependent M28 family amino/carboxypeptidase